MTNPLNVPRIDWTTVSPLSIKPSETLEELALWLAQDSAMWATKCERGEVPLTDALEEIAKNVGKAESVGIADEYKMLLTPRIEEIRYELGEWAKKNAAHMRLMAAAKVEEANGPQSDEAQVARQKAALFSG
jgi:hypothetical protein